MAVSASWLGAVGEAVDEFVDEFVSLKDKYDNTDSASKFNYDTLDLFLKYDIV